MFKISKKIIGLLLGLIIALLVLFLLNYFNEDPYSLFVLEVYDLIQNNYWKELESEETASLFNSSLSNRKELESFIKKELRNKSPQEKEAIVTQMADQALAQLEPKGRSRLYTQKKEEQLSEMVQNIDPKTKKKLATVEHKIIDTPSKPDISQNVAYLSIKRFSPQTLEELQSEAKELSEEIETPYLILDLRGNIGGSIDILPYFLGPFIGPNQYAYETYSQGETDPVKTKAGWLSSLYQYKQVVVLTDEKMQSSAEVFASTLKKYNVGVLVGTTTKGWGTIERVIPLETLDEYSVFLVHSITLRSDGKSIEGNGVDPHIDINDPQWKEKLRNYYNSPDLIDRVESLLND